MLNVPDTSHCVTRWEDEISRLYAEKWFAVPLIRGALWVQSGDYGVTPLTEPVSGFPAVEGAHDLDDYAGIDLLIVGGS